MNDESTTEVFKCFTCPREFDTKSGRGVHHSTAHPEEWDDRFWNYVDDSGEGCWEWDAGIMNDGYGAFNRNDTSLRAHRVAYELEYGEPEGLVCHHCDNPTCCNPEHLYDGTPVENRRDAIERGRVPIGETNHKSKLAEGQVVELREKYANTDITQADLGEEYGVSQFAVGTIVRGENWEHAGGPITNRGKGN